VRICCKRDRAAATAGAPARQRPEGYLRRTLGNLANYQRRRRGGWRRKLLLLRTEAQAPADATAAVDLRNAWLAQTS